jgi:hypothetical protein
MGRSIGLPIEQFRQHRIRRKVGRRPVPVLEDRLPLRGRQQRQTRQPHVRIGHDAAQQRLEVAEQAIHRPRVEQVGRVLEVPVHACGCFR